MNNIENIYDYIIYKNGDGILAKNSATGVVDYSGIDASIVIQNVFNVLTSGGLIFIKNGTYSGITQITPKANTHIVGEEAEKVIFDGIGVKIYPNKHYVTVENVSFTGDPAFAQIYIMGSNHIKIINCSANDIGGSYYGVFVTDAADDTTVSDVLFQDCIITNGGRSGFYIKGNYANNAKVTDVTFMRCQAIGIGNAEGGNWSVGFDINEKPNLDNIKVIDCIARECWESGFHMEGVGTSNNIFFVRCISEDNGQKPIPVYGNGFLVHGNVSLVDCVAKNNLGSVANDGSGSGIFIAGGNDILIDGCILDNNFKYNLLAGYTITRGTIKGNKISNSIFGIQLNNLTSDIIVTDNVVKTHSSISISILGDNCIANNNRLTDSTGYNIKLGGESSNCIVSCNHLTASGQQNIYVTGAADQNHQITNNIILDSTSQSIYLDINTQNTYVAMNYVNKTIYNGGTGNIIKNNVGYVTENNVLSGTFSIDSEGVKKVTIVHGLNITPAVQDCNLTVVQNTAVDDWGYDLLKVVLTDAKNVTIKINISKVSATIGATAKFALKVGKI